LRSFGTAPEKYFFLGLIFLAKLSTSFTVLRKPNRPNERNSVNYAGQMKESREIRQPTHVGSLQITLR
jgi:hypothetical protein